MRHNLTWHRAGRTIRAQAGRVKLLSDSSLQISGVRAQDAGQYHCVATNAHGDSRITVWLLVPGTVGRYPVGHLLKHLTHRGLMAPLRPPSSGFYYCLNLFAVKLSHFLYKKKQPNLMYVEKCGFYRGHRKFMFVVNYKKQPNKCESCPHFNPPVMMSDMECLVIVLQPKALSVLLLNK